MAQRECPSPATARLAQLRRQVREQEAAYVELWDALAYWQMRAHAAEQRLQQRGIPLPEIGEEP